MRLLRLHAALFSMAVKRHVTFRVNLIFEVLLTVGSLAASLAAVLALFTRTDSVGGFSAAEAVVVVGTFHVVSGVRRALVEPNLRFLGNSVASGEFDGLLLQPAPIVFLVSLGGAAPLALSQSALGLVAVVLGGRQAGAGHGAAVGWVALVVCAVAVMWASRTALASSVFFSLGLSLDVAYDAMWQVGAYPTTAFSGLLRHILTYLVPVAFISTIPAGVLIGRLSPAWVAGGALAAAVTTLFMVMLWEVALARYSSATS